MNGKVYFTGANKLSECVPCDSACLISFAVATTIGDYTYSPLHNISSCKTSKTKIIYGVK
jgi:hypothetical protein